MKAIAEKLNSMKKTGQLKMKKTMDEWKEGDLHSGSKTGPVVKNQKQAVAIGLSQQRKAMSGGK